MNTNTRHWLLQRFSALPLIPLFLYFVSALPQLTSDNRADFANWVKQPLTAAAIGVFILCSFYHAHAGISEIIEDYVPEETKTLWKRASCFFFLGLGIVSLYALLALCFGAS